MIRVLREMSTREKDMEEEEEATVLVYQELLYWNLRTNRRKSNKE